MSYYILPKSNNCITINPFVESSKCNRPYISHSLYDYYTETKDLLINTCIKDNEHTYNELIKMINPYEYIFTRVPGSKLSVSKLKPYTNVFYELFEVMNSLYVLDEHTNDTIKTLHIGPSSMDTKNCFDFLRDEKKNDESYIFSKINNDLYKSIGDKRFDFVFYEIDKDIIPNLNLYVISLLRILLIIFKNQSNDGCCIIKVGALFHKSIIDILYIFSSLYEKVYIIKPNTSNITSNEKYIVCKKFILDDKKLEICKNNYYNIFVFLKSYAGNNISSLIDEELPCYFINKVNDINIIIGQQQLESLDQMINILNNKNKHDKIDSFKKIHIQKSVIWCEKYDIPYNKFSDKTNIFLPLEDIE